MGELKLHQAEARHSVLVVDDDPVVLETMVAVLSTKFETVGTRSAREALTLLVTQSFHVIVADWQMPEMDGVTFFQHVGRMPITSAGLLVSGKIEELSERVAWRDRKLLGCLKKPFAPAQLLERVTQMGRMSQMKETIRALKSMGKGSDGG